MSTPQAMKSIFSIASLFLLSMSLMAEVNSQAIEAPVLKLHRALLITMKNANNMSFEERYIDLEPVISTLFNTPLISRIILSRYWNTLDEKKKINFIKLFNRLMIATYISRFDSFNGQSFKTLSIKSIKKDRFLVKTQLVSPIDDPVLLDYIVQKNDGQWSIISVIANGINELSLKRAEYAAMIKNKGYDALITNIEAKVKALHP